jgi:hypothetical protein
VVYIDPMRDPIEQARIDFAAGGFSAERFYEQWEAWGEEGHEIYWRELRGLRFAEAPLPWRLVVALLAADCAMGILTDHVEDNWRRRPVVLLWAPLIALVARAMIKIRQEASQAAARRLGVVHVRDGPPEPPRVPRIIIAVGAGPLGLTLMRRRGVRWPRGRALATTLAWTIVREWEIRRSWRGWTPDGSGQP